MDNTLYDEKTWEALESFHRVWSRVSGPSRPGPEPDKLPKLLTLLHDLYRHYASLAEHFSGEPRALLRKMAQETARDFRRLQAEHYIREGTLFSPGKKAIPRGKRPLLRSAILLEDALADFADGTHPDISTAAGIRKEKTKKLLIASI